MDPNNALAILLDPPRKINLIGVAGSGMSGIAGLLLELGHTVSGSDRVSSVETRRLENLGLTFHLPQTPETVHGADLVIYSSAIKEGNPAYDEAVRLNIPRARRAEALATIMQSRDGIVIAGMHGKTTTSAMAAHVLRIGGLHPSHYVGAEIPILGTNAHWDAEGKFFVAEGKTWSHIMDPRTGYPSQGTLSVSVIAPRTLDSEVWAKPYFVNGRQWAVKHRPKDFQVFFCEDRMEKPCAWLQ